MNGVGSLEYLNREAFEDIDEGNILLRIDVIYKHATVAEDVEQHDKFNENMEYEAEKVDC